jgi:hypothetical protein
MVGIFLSLARLFGLGGLSDPVAGPLPAFFWPDRKKAKKNASTGP